jgi:hypothetical protein
LALAEHKRAQLEVQRVEAEARMEKAAENPLG